MPDAGAAEVVAGLDDALVGDQFERFLVAGRADFVERREDGLCGFARTVQGRRVDGGRGVRLGVGGEVAGGGLGHATAAVGQVEAGEPLVEDVVGVVDLAVADEMDGGRLHLKLLRDDVAERSENFRLHRQIYSVSVVGQR